MSRAAHHTTSSDRRIASPCSQQRRLGDGQAVSRPGNAGRASGRDADGWLARSPAVVGAAVGVVAGQAPKISYTPGSQTRPDDDATRTLPVRTPGEQRRRRDHCRGVLAPAPTQSSGCRPVSDHQPRTPMTHHASPHRPHRPPTNQRGCRPYARAGSVAPRTTPRAPATATPAAVDPTARRGGTR